jgi:hypothetical protein
MSSQDSKPTQPTEDAMNWADYADALSRPKAGQVKTIEKIKGRRLRDQYLDEVTVFKTERPVS